MDHHSATESFMTHIKAEVGMHFLVCLASASKSADQNPWRVSSRLGLDCPTCFWKPYSCFPSGQPCLSFPTLPYLSLSSVNPSFYIFNWQEMLLYFLSPNYEYQDDPWKHYPWPKSALSGRHRERSSSIKFKTLVE